MAILETKEQLRERMREIEHPTLDQSEAIWRQIVNHQAYRNAKIVCAYAPLPNEIDSNRWLARIAAEKQLCLPVVVGKKTMNLRFYTSMEDLTVGAFSIPKPNIGEICPPSDVDLFLIPALGYDLEGYRLGRGKGYYDRLLAKSSAHKMGIITTKRLIAAIPHDKHDIPVDTIITDLLCIKTK